MARFSNEPKNGKVTSVSVANVRPTNYGVFFTLILNGVAINNCKVGISKDGEEFIALPSNKGKDGKFYSIVYFRFSNEDQNDILNMVADAMEK